MTIRMSVHALDIFRNVMQKKDIDTPLEAWLTVLSTQDMGRIEELIRRFPEFADIYREIFEFRTRPEEVINMYLTSFAEADHSTERYMITLMEEENKDLKAQLEQNAAQLEQNRQTIAALMEEIRQLKGAN